MPAKVSSHIATTCRTPMPPRMRYLPGRRLDGRRTSQPLNVRRFWCPIPMRQIIISSKTPRLIEKGGLGEFMLDEGSDASHDRGFSWPNAAAERIPARNEIRKSAARYGRPLNRIAAGRICHRKAHRTIIYYNAGGS